MMLAYTCIQVISERIRKMIRGFKRLSEKLSLLGCITKFVPKLVKKIPCD
jgi:hypothetical protein